MKCEKCGAQLDVGSVFCKKCGEPLQMVPDYNLLDDDFLVSMLEEKKQSEDTQNANVKDPSFASNVSGATAHTAESNDNDRLNKGFFADKKKRTIFIVALIVILVALVVVGIYLTSYAHYVAKGVAADAKEDYEIALIYYDKAIAKDQKKVEAKLLAANDKIILGDYENAETLLYEVIAQDADNVEAYTLLVRLYLTSGDYDALTLLKESVTDDKILAIFDENLVEAPQFSVTGGSFTDDVTVELSASSGTIYYSLDGSDPTDGGIRYSEPIFLEEGTTVLTAVCEDGDKTSEVVKQSYKITYEAPEVVVDPSSGSFTSPTTVTISLSDGQSAYYTWDGTTPTTSSTRYTAPIEIPEGNTILSVIVVDKHGKTSDLAQFNYKYLPE